MRERAGFSRARPGDDEERTIDNGRRRALVAIERGEDALSEVSLQSSPCKGEVDREAVGWGSEGAAVADGPPPGAFGAVLPLSGGGVEARRPRTTTLPPSAAAARRPETAGSRRIRRRSRRRGSPGRRAAARWLRRAAKNPRAQCLRAAPIAEWRAPEPSADEQPAITALDGLACRSAGGDLAEHFRQRHEVRYFAGGRRRQRFLLAAIGERFDAMQDADRHGAAADRTAPVLGERFVRRQLHAAFAVTVEMVLALLGKELDGADIAFARSRARCGWRNSRSRNRTWSPRGRVFRANGRRNWRPAGSGRASTAASSSAGRRRARSRRRRCDRRDRRSTR